MGTTLATYYAKLQDMPDSEYKVEILEDGPIKKIAVNGKIYEVYPFDHHLSPLAWSADFSFFQ